ncbi:MAG: methyltransferase domain-containing protein [Planctomycetota bacterium]
MYSHRARGEEYLDHPDCDPALAVASYRFMARINRWWGGTRAVQRFLARLARRHPPGTSLRVLDIGTGAGDIPRALLRWARRRGIALQITGLEPAAHAAGLARLHAAGEPGFTVLEQDVFAHRGAAPYHAAIASMMAHHLDDAQLRRLLRHLRGIVTGPVLINDLPRSRSAAWGARVLLLGAPPQLRHDALLSIRRGFHPRELAGLAVGAQAAAVRVRRAWCHRVVAEITFPEETAWTP